MIVVTVEIWPKGSELRKKVIGKLKIVNASGMGPRRDYKAWLSGRNGKFMWYGLIERWPSTQKHVWDLISEILGRAR